MRNRIAMLVVALGLAWPAGQVEAREAGMHRGSAVASHKQDAHVHSLERLRRKHDLRRIYHDRRPRRHMRSM